MSMGSWFNELIDALKKSPPAKDGSRGEMAISGKTHKIYLGVYKRTKPQDDGVDTNEKGFV